MTKQEWISHKIGILINEGRPKDQAVAIAYSMYERGDHMQEGGLPKAQFGLTVANGQDLYGNMVQNAQNMQPTNQPPGYTGIPSTSYPAAPNQQDYNKSQGYDPNMGYTGYVQGDANLSGKVDDKDKTDKFGQPLQSPQAPTYNDMIKYNILNPNNTGMDLGTSLAYTGQQFGQGKTGMGAVGAGLSLLKGARSFLSGYGAGKGQYDLEKNYHENQFNRDEDQYRRTENYQQGGELEEEQPIFDIEPQTQSPEWLTSGARMPQTPLQEEAVAAEPTPTIPVPVEEEKNFDKSSARDTWAKKTGLPWSEAKRLGYTDGTAKDNNKLLSELNDPRFKSENLRKQPFHSPTQAKQQVQVATAAKQVTNAATAKNFFDSADYKKLPKRAQAELKEVKELHGWDAVSNAINRTGEILGNPGQAFAYYAKYNEAIPQGFSKNSTNAIDDAIGTINPLNWASHAANAVDLAGQGEYKRAGWEAVQALPAVAKYLKYTKYLPMAKGLPQAGTGKAAGYLGQGAQRIGQGAQTLLHQQGGEIMQQGGLTNADMLTGNYLTGEGQENPNVEVEHGEHIKNAETGQVQEVVGKMHVDGGEKVALPNQSKVLSDYTKIGAGNVKVFNEMFDINTKAGDTFATVLDKFNSKIGVKKLEAEEKELLDKLEKNTKASMDKNTKQINEDFLAQEIAEINKKKDNLNKLKEQAFETIFNEQEKVPKKGDGTQVLNKAGNPIMEKGQEKYQEGGQADQVQQIIQAYAQAAGQDPNEVMQQLQGMQPEQQQAAIQQMLQALQGGQEQPQMQYGGSVPNYMVDSYTKPGSLPYITRELAEDADEDERKRNIKNSGSNYMHYIPGVSGELPSWKPASDFAPQIGLVGQPIPGVPVGTGVSNYLSKKPQMREGGMYEELIYHQTKTVVEEKPYTFATQYTPTVEGYDVTGKSILNQPTLSDVEYMQHYTGKGYGQKMADIDKTINTHKWYFDDEAKKKAFREAAASSDSKGVVKQFQNAYTQELSKKGKEAGLNQEQINKLVTDVGFTGSGVQQFDDKFGAFTSTRPLFDFIKKPAEVTPEAQPGVINRDVVKNIVNMEGLPYVMPPSAPISPYLQQVDLSRLESRKGSVENQLQASENARQAAYAATKGLPPAQAAAMMASYLSTSGQQDTQGIAQQEVADTADRTRVEQYNAGQLDKEKLLNEQLKKQYEREAFGTLNVNEQNWRNYYDANQANQKALSDKIERRNIMNLGLTNYQLNGNGGFDFVNKSPFAEQSQTSAAELAAYNKMTDAEKYAYLKSKATNPNTINLADYKK